MKRKIMGSDWREVVRMKPQGDLELHDPKTGVIVRGPVKSIHVDELERVTITLAWAARGMLASDRTQWFHSPGDERFGFDNLTLYTIENTPLGRLLLFDTHVLHLTPEDSLNPDMVEGFKPQAVPV